MDVLPVFRFSIAPALIAFTLTIPSLCVPLQGQTDSTRFVVCESADNTCSQPDARLNTVWIFNGLAGTTTLPGATAPSQLAIETLDQDTLVVRRIDPSGLSALYTGQIHGSRVNGTVQSTWPGHVGYPAMGVFAAVSQDLKDYSSYTSPSHSSQIVGDVLPTELLVCENDLCNSAWVLQGTEGIGTWFTRVPIKSHLTILRSAPDNIVIRRSPLNGVSATYAGSLRGDHYAGTIVYSSPGHTGDSSASWTASVPLVQCTPKSLEASDAMRIGQTALMFHHDREAFDCYIVAARAGDSTAQAAVGLTFYQGRPTVAQDYPQALFWLRKAADQGVYAAQRTVAEMYLAGQGTSPDPTLAAIYTRRADEQKHNLERREESNERAADRRSQVLSSFVLGASFGIFF